jgi:hypothetical protein
MQRTLSPMTVAPFADALVRRRPVCTDCRRTYRTVWRIVRYSEDERCSHKMIRSILLGFRSGCSGCVRSALLELGNAGRNAKETQRGQLTLKQCPRCSDEYLSFELQCRSGRRWTAVAASSFAEVLPVGRSS